MQIAIRFIAVCGVLWGSTMTWQQPTFAQQRMFGAVSTTTTQVMTGQNGQQIYAGAGGQAVPLPGNGVIGSQLQIYNGMLGKQWYVDRTGAKVFLTVPPSLNQGSGMSAGQPTVINNMAPAMPAMVPVPIPIPMGQPYGQPGYGQPGYGGAPININAPVNINPPAPYNGTTTGTPSSTTSGAPSYGSQPNYNTYNNNSVHPNNITGNTMSPGNKWHTNPMPPATMPNSMPGNTMPQSRFGARRFGASPTMPNQPATRAFNTPASSAKASGFSKRQFGAKSAAVPRTTAATARGAAASKRHWEK